jgi:hypothetical protein
VGFTVRMTAASRRAHRDALGIDALSRSRRSLHSRSGE